MKKKNINKGFKQLSVWQDAIDLYIFTCESLIKFPYELIELINHYKIKLRSGTGMINCNYLDSNNRNNIMNSFIPLFQYSKK